MCKKENQSETNSFEINVNEKDAVIVQRFFMGHTEMDLKIQNEPIPARPLWLNIVVRSIRFYQKRLSPKLGNRCVFDPSCSRYAEDAFRKKGFLRGVKLMINRLRRCHSQNGGIDLVK
jgi:putative membrane protein insertion efficiency factor